MKRLKPLLNELKTGALFFSVLFSVTTLASSIIQLAQGQATDTNSHILSRAVVVFIAVITIMLFLRLKLKSKILSYLLAYAISMSLVFLFVWIMGFFQTLHPNAYRDIFLNFTTVAVLITGIVEIRNWILARKARRQSM